ncbi:hypothetical protein [Succinimonas sp.]|uniref:hypothetical protein n=1 Tax=Succinimonas sp. TaxID=1936151 RepID=UPI00386E8A7F
MQARRFRASSADQHLQGQPRVSVTHEFPAARRCKFTDVKGQSSQLGSMRLNSSKQSNTLNQREKLTRIPEDSAIPLDNSAAETSVRDYAELRH